MDLSRNCGDIYDTIRYDSIAEFNVDSKAEYLALSSTRSQKKIAKKNKLKQTNASAKLIQYRLRSLRSVKAVRKEMRVTMEERICERDEFQVWSERSRE